MKKVYFIPGLGADSQSFKFLDLSFCQPCFIIWPSPAKNDTLSTYAEKVFETIADETATIVGVSLGGMIATEIAIRHPKTRVIIISSSKTYLEVPAYLRMWRFMPVYKFPGTKLACWLGTRVLNVIGARGAEQSRLQRDILAKANFTFIRWAMHAVVNWRNTVVPTNVVHIHGTADKLLPSRFVKAHHLIAGGEHVMIMDRTQEVSRLLQQIVQ